MKGADLIMYQNSIFNSFLFNVLFSLFSSTESYTQCIVLISINFVAYIELNDSIAILVNNNNNNYYYYCLLQ